MAIVSPPELSDEVVDAWRSTLRHAVLQHRARQLDEMVRHGTVAPPLVNDQLKLVFQQADEPRLVASGRTRRPLDEVASESYREGSSLVILGEPGYGKTVALYILVSSWNGADDHVGRPVVDVFALAEWYRWELDNPGARLDEWLADELANTYSNLDITVARTLVDRRLVIPVLDGFDEVPDDQRMMCKEAIEAYAGRAAPWRPVVLTSRISEYRELGADWLVRARHVGLIGLTPDQIEAILEERAAGLGNWEGLRRQLNQSKALKELFRSPLRLSLALQLYRDGDPGELLAMDRQVAEAHLWHRLLRVNATSSGATDAKGISAWLGHLAQVMRHEGRQRIWLHELYLYSPQRQRHYLSFKYRFGLVVGLLRGLSLGLFALGSLRTFLWLALIFGGLRFLRITSLDQTQIEHIRVTEPVSVRMRLQAFMHGFRERAFFWVNIPMRFYASLAVLAALIGAIGESIDIGLQDGADDLTVAAARGFGAGALTAMALGLGLVLVAPLQGMLHGWRAARDRDRVAVLLEPPRELTVDDPRGVLSAARRLAQRTGWIHGRRIALAVGLVLGLQAGMAGGPIYGLGSGMAGSPAFGLAIGVGFGLLYGTTFGLVGWLSSEPSWFYHHWLRRRLARSGTLPRELDEFLKWCSAPARSLMRASDAYEFRHRQFRDYLTTLCH